LKRGGYPFLLGVLAKTGAKTWCFGGEFVVVCVVNVVVQQPLIWARKIRHAFWILFLGFSILGMPFGPISKLAISAVIPVWCPDS
jgi:hypothetical protein